MNSIDLAAMGLKNLVRRRARTVLTVLGVIIGTAAIVVMVSLGLGMNRAFEQQLEAYGSLTTITVYGERNYGMTNMSSSGSGSSKSDETPKLDAETTDLIEALDHVNYVVGFKNFDATLYSGKYMSWTSVQAVDFDKLALMDIDLSQGTMPTTDGQYEVLMGFRIPNDFYDPNSRNYYSSDTPKVDVFSDKIELLPTGNYYDGRHPRGYIINPTGITTDDNYDYAWSIFVDYDTFKKMKTDFDRKNKNSDDDKKKRS